METIGADERLGEGGRSPLSVSEAVARAKGQIDALPTLVVLGEVTGFRGPQARSGHCYFQVKDDESVMDCKVWAGIYAASGVQLRNGLEVQLTGKFDIYPPQGRLSFIARHLSVAGEGLLRQQVAELANKLRREGLMDEDRKRPIPALCTRVAVVTSLSGSVIEDVRRTLARRNPLVELDMVGCTVQGPGAPASIMQALRVAAASQPDAILLVRGGGSFEDLMTFNDEALARAVATCPVPVITGIGHEPDTSICDMVSDRRCSTPTHAAESVAPAIDELYSITEERSKRLGLAMSQRIGRERAAVEALASRPCLCDPSILIDTRVTELLQTEERLHQAIPRSLAARSREVEALGERLGVQPARIVGLRRDEVARATRSLELVGKRLIAPFDAGVWQLAGTLEALSPLRVLSRGYAIVRDADGHVRGSVHGLTPGTDVTVALSDGSFDAVVKGSTPSKGLASQVTGAGVAGRNEEDR